MSFSQAQRIFIVQNYFATRLYAEVQEAFQGRYPDALAPHKKKISRLVDQFHEKCKWQETEWTAVRVDPRKTGRCASKIRTVLWENSLETCISRAYVLFECTEGCKEIKPAAVSHSCGPRTERSGHIKALIVLQVDIRAFAEENGMNSLDTVFFSDKACFHLNGYVNRENSRIWCSENPHLFHEVPLNPEKPRVLCAFSRRRVAGPIFLGRQLMVTCIWISSPS
jgi:hypothetical protein